MNIVLKQLWSLDLQVSSKDSFNKQVCKNKQTSEITGISIYNSGTTAGAFYIVR